MIPFLTPEPYDELAKTPTFMRTSSSSSSSFSSRFFGVPLTAGDSAGNSPRLFPASVSSPKFLTRQKSPLGKTSTATTAATSDEKSVAAALYAELDEERSASAVAANNAMAMITRLQAEKAAVQMEALQYQRMMEEQFEYDQEALEETNHLLLRREEELRSAHAELAAYRRRYGWLVEDEDDYADEATEIGSSCVSFVGEEPLSKDIKDEKTYLLGRKKMDGGDGVGFCFEMIDGDTGN